MMSIFLSSKREMISEEIKRVVERVGLVGKVEGCDEDESSKPETREEERQFESVYIRWCCAWSTPSKSLDN